MALKRTRAEEDDATKKAYARIRAEADMQRDRANRAKTAEEIASEFEAKQRETGYGAAGE